MGARIILLLLLLIPSLCFGQEQVARLSIPFVASSISAGTTAYCTGAATCTATNPGECDQLCEDGEGSSDCGDDAAGNTNCRNTWDFSEAGTSTIDFTYTAGGTYPCASTTNTNVIRVVSDGTNWPTAQVDTVDTGSTNYTQFYFYLEAEGLSNTNSISFVKACVTSGCSTIAWWVGIYDDAGTIKPFMYYYNGSTFSQMIGTSTVSLNAWYRMRVKYDYATTSAEFWLGDTSQGSVSSSVGDRAGRYFIIGTSASKTVTYQIDNISYDDDTTPGACLN